MNAQQQWEKLNPKSKENLIMLIKNMMTQDKDDMVEAEFDKKKFIIIRMK